MAVALSSKPTKLYGYSIAATVIVFDQLTKWLVLGHFLDSPQTIEVTAFFNLVLVWNWGVSFGLFSSDSPWNAVLLSLLAIGIVAFLIRWLFRTERRMLATALGLVIGGAIGNVIDRAIHGAVVDFLDFHVAGWHWPAFNIADSSIFVGAAILIGDALFRGEEKPKTEAQDNADGAG